jgi:virginiamycin A acetyltransferase
MMAQTVNTFRRYPPRIPFKDFIKWVKFSWQFRGDDRRLGYPCRIDFSTTLLMDYGTYIGENTCVKGRLKLGKYSVIGPDCILDGDIEIGNFCSIAPRVGMFSSNHPINRVTTYYLAPVLKELAKDTADRGKIVIGNDVWIGYNATLLKDVTIGDGAVVGAGSVVTHDVEPYSIVAGNPARKIRKRLLENQIEILLKEKWWDWPDEKIREKSEYLQGQKNTKV